MLHSELFARETRLCNETGEILSKTLVRAVNEELEAMVALGFDPVGALRTITALSNYANGFILQEQSVRQPATHNRSVTRDALAELLSEGHAAPLLVAFAEGGSPYNEASFEYGLQALIEGCAALKRRADDPNARSRSSSQGP